MTKSDVIRGKVGKRGDGLKPLSDVQRTEEGKGRKEDRGAGPKSLTYINFGNRDLYNINYLVSDTVL